MECEIVTEEEFKAMLIKDGNNEEEAQLQLIIIKILGGDFKIANKTVRLK